RFGAAIEVPSDRSELVEMPLGDDDERRSFEADRVGETTREMVVISDTVLVLDRDEPVLRARENVKASECLRHRLLDLLDLQFKADCLAQRVDVFGKPWREVAILPQPYIANIHSRRPNDSVNRMDFRRNRAHVAPLGIAIIQARSSSPFGASA